MVVVIEKRDNEWKIVGFIGDINEAGVMYVVRPVVYEDGIIGIYGVGRWFETYEGDEELFEKLVSDLDKLKKAFSDVGWNIRDIQVDKEKKMIVVEFDIIDKFAFISGEDLTLEDIVKEHMQSKIEDMLLGLLSYYS